MKKAKGFRLLMGQDIRMFGFGGKKGITKTKRYGQGPYRNAISLGSRKTAGRGLFRFWREK